MQWWESAALHSAVVSPDLCCFFRDYLWPCVWWCVCFMRVFFCILRSSVIIPHPAVMVAPTKQSEMSSSSSSSSASCCCLWHGLTHARSGHHDGLHGRQRKQRWADSGLERGGSRDLHDCVQEPLGSGKCLSQLRQSLTSSEVQSLTFCRDFAERINVAPMKCSARCGAGRNITTSLVSFMRLDLRAILSFLNSESLVNDQHFQEKKYFKSEFLPFCPAPFELHTITTLVKIYAFTSLNHCITAHLLCGALICFLKSCTAFCSNRM